MTGAPPSGFRPEFTEALALLARAFDMVVAGGHARPVLVGGASVEFYTGGAITSGDFDVVTGAQAALEAALVDVGFRREDRAGHLLRGLYHPTLAMGVEIVSGRLFDGRTDRSRLLLVDVGGHELALPPIEDMIADRMGQHAAYERGVPEMLQQAVALFLLAERIDRTYLDKRIREETADRFGLADLLLEAADDSSDHP